MHPPECVKNDFIIPLTSDSQGLEGQLVVIYQKPSIGSCNLDSRLLVANHSKGGGGGPVVPTVPNVLVGTGVDGASQNDMIAWTMHSEFARIVVRTPVNAGLPDDFWQVQAIFSGKT